MHRTRNQWMDGRWTVLYLTPISYVSFRLFIVARTDCGRAIRRILHDYWVRLRDVPRGTIVVLCKLMPIKNQETILQPRYIRVSVNRNWLDLVHKQLLHTRRATRVYNANPHRYCNAELGSAISCTIDPVKNGFKNLYFLFGILSLHCFVSSV